jgi:hypothetical protein
MVLRRNIMAETYAQMEESELSNVNAISARAALQILAGDTSAKEPDELDGLDDIDTEVPADFGNSCGWCTRLLALCTLVGVAVHQRNISRHFPSFQVYNNRGT